MQLTKHFTLEELYKSDTAVRMGIVNKPTPEAAANLLRLATGLELVRSLLHKPMTVSSGYRCPALNKVVNGVSDSAHMTGLAADFTCWAFGNPEKIFQVIEKSSIQFDQLIMEGSWVHISFDPRMRREVMTALFDSKGRATYNRRSS